MYDRVHTFVCTFLKLAEMAGLLNKIQDFLCEVGASQRPRCKALARGSHAGPRHQHTSCVLFRHDEILRKDHGLYVGSPFALIRRRKLSMFEEKICFPALQKLYCAAIFSAASPL
jgi:hypothetical protein